MRNASQDPRRRGITGRARRFAVSALVACVGLAVSAGAAQAEQLKFTFDDGRINLGDLQGAHVIDPTAVPPDPPAVLTSTYDPGTGAFSAPASGLAFPSKTFKDVPTGNALLPLVDILADFAGAGPIAGDFDSATGDLTTSALPVQATVNVFTPESAGTPEQIAQCIISPVPLDDFASTGELVSDQDPPNDPTVYPADPFDPDGAGVAEWASLPMSTPSGGFPLNGLVCPAVDGLAGGPGGIWLSGTAEVTADPPPGGGGTAGTPNLGENRNDNAYKVCLKKAKKKKGKAKKKAIKKCKKKFG